MNVLSIPFYLLEVESPENQSLIQQLLHSNVFNIILVVLVLGWVIKKFNLLGSIESRQAVIAQEIESIESKKKQALQQLEAIKTRTSKLNKEVEGILASAQASANTLSAQIVQDAKIEAVKIVEASKKRVALEQKSAAKLLEARLMNDALQEARETLTQEMTKREQKRSVESFLEELSCHTAQGES